MLRLPLPYSLYTASGRASQRGQLVVVTYPQTYTATASLRALMWSVSTCFIARCMLLTETKTENVASRCPVPFPHPVLYRAGTDVFWAIPVASTVFPRLVSTRYPIR